MLYIVVSCDLKLCMSRGKEMTLSTPQPERTVTVRA